MFPNIKLSIKILHPCMSLLEIIDFYRKLLKKAQKLGPFRFGATYDMMNNLILGVFFIFYLEKNTVTNKRNHLM